MINTVDKPFFLWKAEMMEGVLSEHLFFGLG